MRKTYTTLLLLMMLLCVAFGCKPGIEPEADTLSFDLSEVCISADAGKATATLTASGPWHVSQKPQWLNYVKPENGGAGVTELTFGGRFYDGSECRSGVVKLVCGSVEATISVIQQPKVTFTVSPEKIIDFPAEGGNTELTVTCDFAPKCDCPQWIECSSPVLQSGVYHLNVKIAPNPGEARSAELRFHNEDDSFEQKYTVSQLSNVLISEKKALLSLYQSCGGASWTKSDNWNSDKELSLWYGVGVDSKGHVENLDLCNNNLTGTLPSSITDLKYLKELYLYGNCLSGNLPKDMRLMDGWRGFSAAKNIYPQKSGYGFISTDSEVAQYQKASKGKGIDIVILGDAFDKSGLELGKGFDALVEKAIDALFAVEPMKSCRNYFNVYAVSAESIVANIGTSAGNTAFGTYFTSSDFSVVTMSTNWDKVFTYAGKAPIGDKRNSIVILLANTSRFGGTTLSWDDGRHLSIIPDFQGGASSTEAQYGFAGLVQHEAIGHAFALLDEEYHTNGLTAPEDFANGLAVKHAKGISLNISADPDITKAPWNELAASNEYKGIDMYEGAGNYTYGTYRSEKDCCMVDNRPYFSAWCRYLIWKRIRNLSEEDSSLEAFIRFDKN